MRSCNLNRLRLATLSILMLGAVGCSSFRHTYDVSPLGMIIPGLVQNHQQSSNPAAEPKVPDTGPLFASSK